MITLYQFPAMFGLRNPSSFCLKTETCLRMLDLPFQVETRLDPRKAPVGKLPYIKDEGDDSQRIVHDSGLILRYLNERYGISLDKWLSAESAAQGRLLSSALENNYYWAVVYSRFDGRNWPFVRQELSGLFPHVLRYVLPTVMQAQARAALRAQGLGRLTPGEIYERANADMEAAAMVLGDQDFLFGEQPCSHDAALYGLVHNVVRSRYDSPLKAFIEASPQLANFERRIRERYFESDVESAPGLMSESDTVVQ